jgi:hypothetical protein
MIWSWNSNNSGGSAGWDDRTWKKYYELEWAGAVESIPMHLMIAEMIEEGRHYIGVNLVDEETNK